MSGSEFLNEEVRITRAKLVDDYSKALSEIPTLEPHTREILADIYEQSLQEWETAVVERLHAMARLWEQIMDGTVDESLYTLGIRRAIDVVTGTEPDLTKPVPGTEEQP